MSENCDVIVIFPIYGQFSVIRKPYSGCIVYKTYINLPFISQKLKVELKNHELSSHTIALSKGTFCTPQRAPLKKILLLKSS